MRTIGIDIDDTLTKTSDGIRSYIVNHCSEFENASQLLLDTYQILLGHRISNDTTKFLNDIYPSVAEQLELRENALHVLNKLKAEGYKIVLITARADAYYPRGAELITREYLTKQHVPYDVLVTHSFDKKKACIDNKVDIMIDDSIKSCEALREIGIETLLFTTEHNRDIETNIPRVNKWLEIYNIFYEKVS